MKVYLSEEQYIQLLNNGSITVGGTTVIYNPNDDYITPLDNKIYIEKSEVESTYAKKSGDTFTGNIILNKGNNTNPANLVLTESSMITANYGGASVSVLRSQSGDGIHIGSEDAPLIFDSQNAHPDCHYWNGTSYETNPIALLNDVPDIFTTQTGTTSTKTLRIYTDSNGYLHIDTE